MSTRRIVIIGSAYPLRGGLAAYNERLAREYQKRGDEVRIYSFALQYPSVFFPGKTQFTDAPEPPDLTIRTLINSVNPFTWIRAGREIRLLKPDLVIVKFWMPFFAPCLGTICRIIKKNRHSRIISILDNIIPHERRPGDRLLSKWFVRSVDGFITMSKSVLSELEEFDTLKPKKFSPHPLYDQFGDPVPKGEAISSLGLDPAWSYVLFFGFIRDYKGLDLLLLAFADPWLQERRVKVLIAGEFYTDPGPYLEIIRRHHLEERVILSNDYIPDHSVRDYFCAADLVVQPYKSATQSGVTQIAFHFNKPMVVTDTGGLAEFVPDGKAGFVVNPDPHQIAGAVERFYRDMKEQEFSEAVGNEKEKYSWNTMLETIDSLFTTHVSG